MDSQKVGLISLLIFVLILPLLAMTFVLDPFLRNIKWLNLNALRMSGALVFCLATLLGWASIKTKEGRVTAILGTLMIVTVLGLSLVRTGPPRDFGPEHHQVMPAESVSGAQASSSSSSEPEDLTADEASRESESPEASQQISGVRVQSPEAESSRAPEAPQQISGVGVHKLEAESSKAPESRPETSQQISGVRVQNPEAGDSGDQ